MRGPPQAIIETGSCQADVAGASIRELVVRLAQTQYVLRQAAGSDLPATQVAAMTAQEQALIGALCARDLPVRPVRSSPSAPEPVARSGAVASDPGGMVAPALQAGMARLARADGPVTAATRTVLLHQVLPLASTTGPGTVLVVDLSAVTELDGAGVEALCALRAQARITGGDLHVTAVPARLADVLTQGAPPGDPLAQGTEPGDLLSPVGPVVSASRRAAR